MKKLTVLFTVFLLFSVTVVGLASDWEVIGGFTYTTIDSDELDDFVDSLNNSLEEEAYGYDVDISKVDKIDSGSGFYLGGRLPINENIKIGGYYEYFNADTEGKVKSLDFDEEIKIEMEIPVNGLVGIASYNINDYLAVNGGLGYYFGEIEIKTGPFSIMKTDLNGLGFKLGTDLNYPLNEKISIIGAANYRILTLEADDYYDDDIDFNGFEFKGGISCKL
ncbi:MAG: porin family protein [Firmicutes bacterium]|nr:porin family protein [Bacillota bacterium]